MDARLQVACYDTTVPASITLSERGNMGLQGDRNSSTKLLGFCKVAVERLLLYLNNR